MQVYIERYSNDETLPDGAVKELKRDKGDEIKDYAFRTSKLRLYFFKDPDTGNILVLGALKDTKGQSTDIDKLRGIKKRYFQSKKVT